MSLPEALDRAARKVAPIPRGDDGAPVFEAPWQAQAFAMTLTLHERGLFTWSEWAAALGAAISATAYSHQHEDEGTSYYGSWLAALERLIAEKGLASPAALDERRAAWERAAAATPHGEPILLTNDPLRRA